MASNEVFEMLYVVEILYYAANDDLWRIGAVVCKNRDKRIYFIVRVIASALLLVMVLETVLFSG
jgi:hypothetical protein